MHDLAVMEDRLGYHFERPELLRCALIHPSAEAAKGVTREDTGHAKRLSWLGDSVLDMVVSHKLYGRFPTATKDQLHHWCVRLTNNQTLGRVAQELGMEEVMLLGRSLQQNFAAKDRHVMLANALEAVIGAVFADGGIQRARAVIWRVLAEDFRKLLAHGGDLGANGRLGAHPQR